MSRREILMHLVWVAIVLWTSMTILDTGWGMSADQMSLYLSGMVPALCVGVVIGWAGGRYHGFNLAIRQVSRPFVKGGHR